MKKLAFIFAVLVSSACIAQPGDPGGDPDVPANPPIVNPPTAPTIPTIDVQQYIQKYRLLFRFERIKRRSSKRVGQYSFF